MNRLFFTSDQHFNHSNIIKLAGRPFDNVHNMNTKMINTWNATVSKQDTVWIIGDFVFGPLASGYNTIVPKLNGYKYLILGNHDSRNRIKNHTLLPHVHNFGMWHIIHTTYYWYLLIHDVSKIDTIPAGIISSIDIIVCGHVHNNWVKKTILNKPVVNVSVDVHRFRPISEHELITIAENR